MTRKIRPEQKKDNPNCQFGRWPDGTYQACYDPTQCESCGWNPKVAAERKAEVRKRFGMGT